MICLKQIFLGTTHFGGRIKNVCGAVIPNSYPWLQACTPVD